MPTGVAEPVGRRQGLTSPPVTQIAGQLQLSYETARTYGKTVRRKLGAKSRLELVGRAMDVVLGRRS